MSRLENAGPESEGPDCTGWKAKYRESSDLVFSRWVGRVKSFIQPINWRSDGGGGGGEETARVARVRRRRAVPVRPLSGRRGGRAAATRRNYLSSY